MRNSLFAVMRSDMLHSLLGEEVIAFPTIEPKVCGDACNFDTSNPRGWPVGGLRLACGWIVDRAGLRVACGWPADGLRMDCE